MYVCKTAANNLQMMWIGPLSASPHANCHSQRAEGQLSINSRNMTIYVINFLICTDGSRSLAEWRC